ncbi:MAG TPA: citrate lyase acyl carrier protein [Candidatus Izemoplasmatales bacterium]|nr:citrate lyase acyl carrier protein [Candidatus Izemoplasmatales bacterium]
MIYQAGSKESNDCLIMIQQNEQREIHIDSIVGHLFYDQILKAIKETLAEEKLEKVRVIVEDKGALDYTIRARLKVAIRRMRKDV